MIDELTSEAEQAQPRCGLAVVDVATQSVHTILDHPSRDGQGHFAVPGRR